MGGGAALFSKDWVSGSPDFGDLENHEFTLADQSVRMGGNMRRLIVCLSHLLLGMILGMIFVAIVHSCPSRWQERVRATGITIGYDEGRALRR